jgi:hypothetical protein
VNIWVSDHAADRYVERVKPSLTRKQARREIEGLAKLAGEPQPYCRYAPEQMEFEAYLELAPGIAIALRPHDRDTMLVVTTIIQGSSTPGEVRRRREEKRKRKQKSRAQKRKERIARKTGRARREE